MWTNWSLSRLCKMEGMLKYLLMCDTFQNWLFPAKIKCLKKKPDDNKINVISLFCKSSKHDQGVP